MRSDRLTLSPSSTGSYDCTGDRLPCRAGSRIRHVRGADLGRQRMDRPAAATRAAVSSPIDLLGHGTADKPHDPAAYAATRAARRGAAARTSPSTRSASRWARGSCSRSPPTSLTASIDWWSRVSAPTCSATDPRNAIVKAIRGEAGDDNPAAQYFAGLARQPGNDPDALVACMQSPPATARRRPPRQDHLSRARGAGRPRFRGSGRSPRRRAARRDADDACPASTTSRRRRTSASSMPASSSSELPSDQQ